jgi:hypothetical protein
MGCGVPAASYESGLSTRREAIIDGAPAPERTGVVHVAHPQSDLLCSGTIVAPTLMLTTKHCVLRSTSSGYQALTADGFQIGFGPDVEHLVIRAGSELRWIGSPDDLDVASAVANGVDVAAVVLGEPVPAGTHIHSVTLDYQPRSGDTYELVGYGLSSLATWDSGTKRSTRDTVSAFDPPTGIIESTGQGACNGDSGGPFLHGQEFSLIGVISEIGNSDGGVCDLGKTYASSVANPTVRDFIAAELARLPPCSERAEVCGNGQDENCNGLVDEGCDSADAGAGGVGGGAGAPAGDSGGAAGAAASDGGSAASGQGGTLAGRGGATGHVTTDQGCSCAMAGAKLRPNWGVVALLALLVLAGCKKGEGAPRRVTGVPECDAFLAKYARCIEERLPDTEQGSARKALDVHRSAWQRAATTPGGKAALVATCRQVTEQTRQATRESGCDL